VYLLCPAAARKKKKGHGETVIPPRSLFEKASMLKVRREGKDQKKNFSLKQPPFAKPLPSLAKPAMEAGQDNPEWLISEDWALLQVASQRAERIAKEKKALAEQQKAQQLAQQQAGAPQSQATPGQAQTPAAGQAQVPQAAGVTGATALPNAAVLVQPAQAGQVSPQLATVAAARPAAVNTVLAPNTLQVTRLGQIPTPAGQTAQVTLTKPPGVSVPAVVSTVSGISVAINSAQKTGTPTAQVIQQKIISQQVVTPATHIQSQSPHSPAHPPAAPSATESPGQQPGQAQQPTKNQARQGGVRAKTPAKPSGGSS
ncbi:hypothetical protein XENOCAPTIV_028348, partial [Xenoophorus captivus]